jgi:hypothetical protein
MTLNIITFSSTTLVVMPKITLGKAYFTVMPTAVMLNAILLSVVAHDNKHALPSKLLNTSSISTRA